MLENLTFEIEWESVEWESFYDDD